MQSTSRAHRSSEKRHARVWSRKPSERTGAVLIRDLLRNRPPAYLFAFLLSRFRPQLQNVQPGVSLCPQRGLQLVHAPPEGHLPPYSLPPHQGAATRSQHGLRMSGCGCGPTSVGGRAKVQPLTYAHRHRHMLYRFRIQRASKRLVSHAGRPPMAGNAPFLRAWQLHA